MALLRLFLLLSLFTIAFSHEPINSHLLPRPLILEFPENIETQLKSSSNEEVRLQCTSWRFAVETNNLSPWKTIPEECEDYVKEYLTSRAYGIDLEIVAKEAEIHAKGVELSDDRRDVWVFDIDETLLSNLPYYAEHGYGLEVFNSVEFDKWVEKAMAPAIESSLKLYEEVLSLGFKVFLLTGRSERHRTVTVENLMKAGYQNWDKLILRSSDDHGKLATIFKSEKRSEMKKRATEFLVTLEINGAIYWDLQCLSARSNFQTPCIISPSRA